MFDMTIRIFLFEVYTQLKTYVFLKSISEVSALFLSSGILQLSACVLWFFTMNINRKADYLFHSFPTVTVKIQRGYGKLNASDCGGELFFPHQPYWDL